MVANVNSTRPAADRQPTPEPEPGYYCQAMSVPLEVVEAIGTPIPHPKRTDLRFTDSHAMLIGYVGMMVNWKKVGCWASNRRLAELLRKSERRVEQLIRDCRRFKFIRDLGNRTIEHGGRTFTRRVLETAWCRVRATPSDDPKPISGAPDRPKLISGARPKPVSDNSRNTKEDRGAGPLRGRGVTPPDESHPPSKPAPAPRVGADSTPMTPAKPGRMPPADDPNDPPDPGAVPLPVDEWRRRQGLTPYNLDRYGRVIGWAYRPPVSATDPPAPTVHQTQTTPPNSAPADDELVQTKKSPHDRRPRCAATPADESRAARLKAVAAACGWAVTAFSRREWADQMHYLANDLTASNQDPAEIDAVLGWMEREKPAKPTITTAAQFRKHWGWLTGLMRGSRRAAPPPDPAADAPDVAEEIERQVGRGWPRGVADDIPAIFRRAVAAVVEFTARVKRWTPPGDLEYYRDKLLDELADPVYAVGCWLTEARAFALEKEGWKGPFPDWRPDEYSAKRAVFDRTKQFMEWDGQDYERVLKGVLRDR